MWERELRRLWAGIGVRGNGGARGELRLWSGRLTSLGRAGYGVGAGARGGRNRVHGRGAVEESRGRVLMRSRFDRRDVERVGEGC